MISSSLPGISPVVLVLLHRDGVVLHDVLDLERAAGDQEVLVVRHGGEVEGGVPGLADLLQLRLLLGLLGIALLLVLEHLEQLVLGHAGLLGDHVGGLGHAAEADLPVRVGLAPREGHLLAVLGERGHLGGAQDVRGAGDREVVLAGLAVLAGVVGVAGEHAPLQQQVRLVDLVAVRPLRVLELVLHCERVVRDLLVGAEALVGMDLLLRVHGVEALAGHLGDLVVDVQVGLGVARVGAGERVGLRDGHDAALLARRAALTATLVPAAAHAGAAGQSECCDRRDGDGGLALESVLAHVVSS
ncbi:hypothetical protein [Kocuria rhizophila]|uniref:hypothetical protein n=1 Tax=Kocuria rhizophila TaxID=72000 RepID=UPI0021A2DBA5|nr:hypothetical protein [Kocuria rhizophila]MCT2171261.1 hypothetical protein [Kocuria rhizophila]